jgi:hypothetical protein
VDTAAIIGTLEAQRDRLDRAIAALRGGARRVRRRSRLAGVRMMSAAARRRISLAQKKRWAAVKATKVS